MFYFVEKFMPNTNGNDKLRLITIDKSVVGKSELFRRFSDLLQFPDYFGRNFDAFYDLISDLYWLQEEEIVIYHESLPLLDESSLANYLDILNRTDVEWETYNIRAEKCKQYMISQGGSIPSNCWFDQKPKIFNVYFQQEDKECVERILRIFSKNYRECIHYDEKGDEYID